MATSGSFPISTSNAYISGYLQWWEQNVNDANNTSDVYVEMRLQRTNTGYTTSGTDTFWVKIDGTQYNATTSYNLSYNSWTLIMSATKTGIQHNGDGTRSIVINWGGGGGAGGAFTVTIGNGTATLTKTNRQSVLVSPIPSNLTAGDSGIPFSITQYVAGATNTAILYVQDTSNNYQVIQTWNNIGTSGTLALSTQNNTDMFTYLAQRASAPTILRIWTYDSNNVQIGGNNDNTGYVYAPNATTPTLPNFNIGSTVTVTLNSANSLFTHTLSVSFQGYTRTLVTNNPNGNYSWNTSLNSDASNMYSKIPNSATGTGTITCTTYYNGVQVQSPIISSNFTATVVNSNPTFTTISYLDNNSTYSTLTGNNQYIIQNKSDLLAKVLSANKATAQNSATISKYVATFNGTSITVNSPFATDILFDFGTVNVSSNQNLTISAYDSRGFKTTVTMSVNIVPYSPPTVITTAARGSGFTSTVTITLSGSISPLNVNGVNKNSMNVNQVTYAYGTVGSALGTATLFTGVTLTMPNYSATSVSVTMANTSAWNVQVKVTDQITTTTVNLVVPIGVPIMFIDKVMKNIGIGMFPVSGQALSVTGGHMKLGTVAATATPYVMAVNNWSNAAAGSAQIIGGWQGTQYWGIGTDSSSGDMTVQIGVANNVGTWQSQTTNLKVTGKVQEGNSQVAPVGEIKMYGGSTAPTGYLICDGSAVSRTTYSALFGVIGTNFGVGDGSTTFNLPNFAGRMPIGLYSGDTSFNTLGLTGGEKNHTLTTSEMPAHAHNTPTNLVNASGGGSSTPVASGSSYGFGYNQAYTTDTQGGGAAHNNMPPYSVVYFIIKT